MASTKVLHCSHGQALCLGIANRYNSQKGVRYVNLRVLDLLMKSSFFKKSLFFICPKYCFRCCRAVYTLFVQFSCVLLFSPPKL